MMAGQRPYRFGYKGSTRRLDERSVSEQGECAIRDGAERHVRLAKDRNRQPSAEMVGEYRVPSIVPHARVQDWLPPVSAWAEPR